jgi:hypothetical protein
VRPCGRGTVALLLFDQMCDILVVEQLSVAHGRQHREEIMNKDIDEVIKPFRDLFVKTKDKWTGSTNKWVKELPTTTKGDFGEMFMAQFIKDFVGMPTEIINGGKGPYDLRTKSGVTFECKLATEDINGGFQFNGLKKDVEYDFALCFGVSPNELWFGIWSKKDVKKLTVPMTKGGSDSFKLSARKAANAKYPMILLTKENFKREVSKIV